MAVLPDVDRVAINAIVQRHWSALQVTCGITKSQLKAAVDTTDQWIEDNAPSYNAALPVAARNNLSASQKTLLLCAVALRRAGLDLL